MMKCNHVDWMQSVPNCYSLKFTITNRIYPKDLKNSKLLIWKKRAWRILMILYQTPQYCHNDQRGVWFKGQPIRSPLGIEIEFSSTWLEFKEQLQGQVHPMYYWRHWAFYFIRYLRSSSYHPGWGSRGNWITLAWRCSNVHSLCLTGNKIINFENSWLHLIPSSTIIDSFSYIFE